MADDADLSEILRGLGPDAPVDVSMPPEVWARLSAALAEESLARASAATTVDELAIRRGVRESRRGYSRRWATGLVAASAVVLAGVVLAGVVREEAPVPLASPAGLTEPAALSAAGILIPPAKVITSTDTDYSLGGISEQVAELVEKTGVGATTAGAAAAMDTGALRTVSSPEPVSVPLMFAEPFQRLRDCVTSLTHSAEASALVIDLSTFEGEPSGVVVMPAQDNSFVMVHVVGPDCERPLHLLIPGR